MTFMSANGVTVPAAANSLEEEPEYIGDSGGRAVDGELIETNTEKGSYKAEVTFLAATEGYALGLWLRALWHAWRFDDHTYSNRGLGPKAGGTYAQSGSGGKYGGSLVVTSGSLFEVAFANAFKRQLRKTWAPTLGWTFFAWKNESGYKHFLAKGAVAVTRGASTGNPAGVTQYEDGAEGSHGIGNFLSVASDGDVAIHGYASGGGAGDATYDGFVFLPFEIPDDWAASVYAFHDAQAWTSHPRAVQIDGDAFEDSPFNAVVRVDKVMRRHTDLGTASRVMPISFRQV